MAVFASPSRDWLQAWAWLALILLIATPAGSRATTQSIDLGVGGGVYSVPVVINDALTLDFVIDTGATAVLIPADVALTLIRTRTITDEDLLGVARSQLADGSVIENARINFRSLRIGTRILRDVEGIVGPFESSLLLGQSALVRLEPWQLDTRNRVLVLMEPDLPSSGSGIMPRAWSPEPDALATVHHQPTADSPAPATDTLAADLICQGDMPPANLVFSVPYTHGLGFIGPVEFRHRETGAHVVDSSPLRFDLANARGQRIYRGHVDGMADVVLIDLAETAPRAGSEVSVGYDGRWGRGVCAVP